MFCWGSLEKVERVTPAAVTQSVKKVAVGGQHACVIKLTANVNLELQCWGNNLYGQAASPAGGEFWASVHLGMMHSCAVNVFSYSVECWGLNLSKQTDVPDIVRNKEVLQLGLGYKHSCALVKLTGKKERMVSCWGDDQFMQVRGLREVSCQVGDKMAVGWQHNCQVNSDQQGVSCWGGNSYGQAPEYFFES